MRQFPAMFGMLLALAASGPAGTIYATGFEQPEFLPGPLTQAGWRANSAGAAQGGSYQTLVAHSGAQALEIDSSPILGTGQFWRDTVFNPLAAGTPVVDVSWSMRLSGPGDPVDSEGWGLEIFDTSDRRVATALVTDQGEVAVWRAQTDTVIATGSSVLREVWNDYHIRMDYSTGFGALWVNGAPIVSDLLLGSNQDFARANFAVFVPGFDQAYFDDFRIAAYVPEPGGAVLMVVLMVGARRRWR